MDYSRSLRFVIFILISFVLASCTYEKIEEETDLPKEISFQKDIMPFFNASCNSSGCHNDGGISPDLSPANAYEDIKTTGMLDMTTPENSVLYARMIDVADPMPLTGVMPYESSVVLSWITDGANDN